MAGACRTLHILHTNDLHSHFRNMPHISTCLHRHRAEWEKRGEHVLTVDIGDHVDRMNVMTEATWGHSNVKVLNHSGYQYVTIGNNEGITFPKDKLDELYEQADFTVIVNNLIEPATGMQPHWAVPYAIHQWPDLRVAILGATIAFSPFYQMLGWEVSDPVPHIRNQVTALRSQADLIVVLSHLGYQQDVKLAQEVPGLDVILGAHTHHLLERGETVEGTLIAQVGRFGEYVGHVQLTLTMEDNRVLDAVAEVFPVKDYPPDEELQALLLQEKQAAETLLARPVTQLKTDLQIGWTEETPFGSMLAASIRRWTRAEVGLANGGLQLTPLQRGTVTYGDLLHCLPHPINPCAVTLTGAQLLQVLQRSIQPEAVHRELRGFGFRGKLIGWLGVDGLIVHYGDDSAGRRITGVQVNGQPLDLHRDYRVGTIDMFMFSRIYPELLEGRDLRFFLPEMLREVLAETIRDEQLIQESFQPRWLRV
ncbi:bifunctional metallophosphatase/5'-nucleotidase [Brevibacillus sp. H7]|uniref:bifunctional metallophosphatase/5'-nucleotidase n=1 Tax=Brevibacillus sp. H7 TaxID=3349138 RepID=UPI0038013BE3